MTRTVKGLLVAKMGIANASTVLAGPQTAAVDLTIVQMALTVPTACASLHRHATTSSIARPTDSFVKNPIAQTLSLATAVTARPALLAPTTTIHLYVCPMAPGNARKIFNAQPANIVTSLVTLVRRVVVTMPIALGNAPVQTFARATIIANASPMAAVHSAGPATLTASAQAEPFAPMMTHKPVLPATCFLLATATRAVVKSVT